MREAPEVTLDRLDSPTAIEALRTDWLRIQQGGELPVFLSWDWAEALLAGLPPTQRPRALRVRLGGETCAVALIGHRVVWRRGVFRIRQLVLNAIGSAEYDAPTIEYNGLAARAGAAAIAVPAFVEHIASSAGWDEFRLPGLGAGAVAAWVEAGRRCGLAPADAATKPAPFLDLTRLRSTGQDVLSSLSANTRYQVRRALKLYAARGAVALRQAASVDEAEAWLDELIALHQAYWVPRGQPGAFSTPFLRDFHRRLVRGAFERSAVELVRVSAGPFVLGYLYNFRTPSSVQSYQSGFCYEDDAKLKPGLVCHTLAAQDALDRGLATYDLLAGDSTYKRSLANAESAMSWTALQRPRLVLRAESALIAAYRRWRTRRRTPDADRD